MDSVRCIISLCLHKYMGLDDIEYFFLVVTFAKLTDPQQNIM